MKGSCLLKLLLLGLLSLTISACGGGGGGGGGDANQAPTASFSMSPASGVVPLQVSFDAGASSDRDGTLTSYAWSFGDGQNGSGSTIGHTYTSAGSYTVTLTVTDNAGATGSRTATLTASIPANQAPTAAITATPASGTAPLQVAFDGSASSDADGSITAYDWAFGDGQSGNGAVTSHTYSTAGSYTATLTVTDNEGGSDTASTTISVNNPPLPTFSLSGTITSADNIAVDSDLNDPLAAYAGNDEPAEAQTVPNPVMLNGFVSQTATGISGDRFAAAADTMDFFRTSLYAGQYVSLRVASFDAAAPASFDVDIQLYDTSLNLVAASDTVTEFESMAVPADGEYYIRVLAYSGINKYILSIGSVSLATARAASGWTADFVPDQAMVKMRPQTVGIQSVTPLGQLPALRLSHDRSDRLALLSLDRKATMTEAFSALNAKVLPQSQRDWSTRLPQETRKKLETLDLIKQLNQRQDVAAASPNFKVRAMLEPNDTYYSYQEHYRQIRLPQAWDITTGTPASGSVIVAVVDSGIAMDHEDFGGQLVTGYDFVSDPAVSNDGDGIDDDPNDPGTSTVPGESGFHGTHVAGTIAAASNNGLGVAGIAWGARIMPLRVLGLGGSGTMYDVIQAMRYAAGLSNDSGSLPAQRADIINLSLSGGDFNQASQDAFAEIRNAGVVVVAAAGNSNTSVASYPAAYDGVVSVSAMDWQNAKAPYSNYGSSVDVAAPGGNMQVDTDGDGYGDGVLSCVINDSSGQRVSNYAFYQGTSMASPHVAGVSALMKAVYPAMTPDDFDTLLAAGELTNDLGDPGRDDIYGYGMIDALKAVEAAQTAAGTPVANSVIASSTSVDFGITLQAATITLTGRGAAPPQVTAFSSSEPWLNVTAGTVDGSGLGDYELTVDRSGLVDAVYRGTVSFSLSDGNSITISVSMRVLAQPAGVTGNAGFLHLMLLDLSLNSQGELNLSPVDGSYDFEFQNVAAGDYYLVAGSDVDNNGKICEVGESCGAYPVRNQEVAVTVDRNISGLDFMATINSGLSESAQAASVAFPGGIPVKRSDKHPKRLP
ncbi:MAG: S8 family serine peptidase [Candidatus Thiodiazotropha sp.]